jgi:hypothetical protein
MFLVIQLLMWQEVSKMGNGLLRCLNRLHLNFVKQIGQSRHRRHHNLQHQMSPKLVGKHLLNRHFQQFDFRLNHKVLRNR